jgi:signal transduction histidine kinase
MATRNQQNKRILVADDERNIVQAYIDFLNPKVTAPKRSSRSPSAGAASPESPQEYEILTANNGVEALYLFKTEFEAGRRIAGGFFDVKMEGGIDGLQTIQEIWKIDPEMHCTVVTAYHDRSVDDIDQLFGSRFKDQWDYLNKPFTQAEIVQKARQMLAAWNHKQSLKEAQEQLIRSERMAAIGQVARGIGHEFGNLLQTIIGRADLALLEKDPAKFREKLEAILRAGERAAVIVRNLQSFTKTQTTVGPVQLSQCIRNVLSLVNHELTKNSIEAVIVSESKTPILGNENEIEQVFLNLFINAIHAMPRVGRLEVGSADDGTSVRAWVKDTGTGISPDVLPHIFEYAFTTKGDQGSGLGLSISKEIVEKYNGTIDVQSLVGKGTAFMLRFPAQQAGANK